jgi:sugar transferase EpsL
MRLNGAVGRAAEIVMAALIGLVLTPVMVAISAVILFGMGAPVIFRHRRVGYRQQPFTLYKFRTMSSRTGPDGGLLPDFQRLTRIGQFLRKTSLDELPQLWNVVRGEMSFVGPRPLLSVYLPRYNARQRRRHEVRPGITGWAQVHGRNALTWERKFEMDVWYVDHRSFWLDMKILFFTALKVMHREGIAQQGHVTMPEFLGSGDRYQPE